MVWQIWHLEEWKEHTHFICLTIVLFPDSPAPERENTFTKPVKAYNGTNCNYAIRAMCSESAGEFQANTDHNVDCLVWDNTDILRKKSPIVKSYSLQAIMQLLLKWTTVENPEVVKHSDHFPSCVSVLTSLTHSVALQPSGRYGPSPPLPLSAHFNSSTNTALWTYLLQQEPMTHLRQRRKNHWMSRTIAKHSNIQRVCVCVCVCWDGSTVKGQRWIHYGPQYYCKGQIIGSTVLIFINSSEACSLQ